MIFNVNLLFNVRCAGEWQEFINAKWCLRGDVSLTDATFLSFIQVIMMKSALFCYFPLH